MDTNGSATDSWNDGCDWYTTKKGESTQAPASCGTFDDGDFTAASMCCACGGGEGIPTCYDNPLARDIGGDGCDWYRNHSDQCGHWDGTDFTAATDCGCVCGGSPSLAVNLQVKPKFQPLLAAQAKPSMNLSASKKSAMMLL